MEQRQFKLKPYWKKWFERMKQTREDNLVTKVINWDETDWAFGGFSVTIPPARVKLFIRQDLNKIYHRNNLTLKIFFDYPATLETTKIQNFYAQAILAPRVYGLVILTDEKKRYVAQVTDYISGNFPFDEHSDENIANICSFGDNNCISYQDLASSNFKKKMFVDFSLFKFQDYFEEKFKEKVSAGLGFGSSIPYQSIETLNVPGERDNWDRCRIFEKAFKEDKKRLPKNFTVLDFGCNGGFFLRRAFDWGAGYGVGVDKKEIAKMAEQVTVYAGYFNADFFDYLPDREFDFVFYLSMDAHYPLVRILPAVKNILYLEGHAGNGHDERKYREMLEPDFKTVDLLGSISDYPKGEPRLLFRAVR